MTDKKYIVKNCPSLDTDGTTCQDCSFKDCGMEDCFNRTDCLIKEVIDDCKESIKHYENEGWKSDDCLKLCGEASMSFRLLQLLEIEECDNEDL